MWEKVILKVEDFIVKDIVEWVNGLMLWVSLVVIVLKVLGDIRLCVDMRKVNVVIICERIFILIVDEVLENFNGSVVFLKLDFCLGFY